MKKINKLFSVFFALIIGASVLTGCNEEKGRYAEDGTYYPENFVNYAENSVVKLNRDYKLDNGSNRNFYEDGISEVTVKSYIDGDTTHFKMKEYDDSRYIQSRYYGVNTPESTGAVEPYGKTASNFTKKTLSEAKTIVISADTSVYERPKTDSTGSRYLTMVWFSNEENAPYNKLISLNLLLVQEGLSMVNGVDSLPEFLDVFYKAETQARDNKMRLHSGKIDPNFNYGEYQTTDLFSIQEEVLRVMAEGGENKYDNQRVRIVGTVAGYFNHTLFLQAKREKPDTNPVEFEYAGINIFCGMNPIESKFKKINTRIELCGLCQDSPEFGFQITSVKGGFPAISNDDPDSVKILSKPEQTIENGLEIYSFETSNISDLKANKKFLNSPVEIKDKVFEVYEAIDTNQIKKQGGTLKIRDTSDPKAKVPFEVYLTFAYYPYKYRDDIDVDRNTRNTSYEKASQLVGKKFKFKGIYTARKAKEKNLYYYQINPTSSRDIEIVLDK